MEAEVARAVLRALGDEGTRGRVADLVCSAELDDSAPSRADAIRAELGEIGLAYSRIWSAIEQGIAPPGGRERVDSLKERQRALEEELRVEEARRRLVIDRDRVLFWLERMARATDEQVVTLFVSRAIVRDDGTMEVTLMIDGEDPPPDGPDDGRRVVRPDSGTGHQDFSQVGVRLWPVFLYIHSLPEAYDAVMRALYFHH